MSEEKCIRLLRVWLSTDFESGRHQKNRKLDEN